jgi:hypothetical protein
MFCWERHQRNTTLCDVQCKSTDFRYVYCIYIGLCISEGTNSYPILNDVLFTSVFKSFCALEC